MDQMSRKTKLVATTHIVAIAEIEGKHHVATLAETRVSRARAAPMIRAYDSLTEAQIMFFEAASAGETDSRLRSEVYLAQAFLARPHAYS